MLMGRGQPRLDQLARDAIDRRRRDRSCVHVEPNTRTLGKHRGLPQLSDRPSRQPLLGNPRICVSEAPARNPSAARAVTPYRLGDWYPLTSLPTPRAPAHTCRMKRAFVPMAHVSTRTSTMRARPRRLLSVSALKSLGVSCDVHSRRMHQTILRLSLGLPIQRVARLRGLRRRVTQSHHGLGCRSTSASGSSRIADRYSLGLSCLGCPDQVTVAVGDVGDLGELAHPGAQVLEDAYEQS